MCWFWSKIIFFILSTFVNINITSYQTALYYVKISCVNKWYCKSFFSPSSWWMMGKLIISSVDSCSFVSLHISSSDPWYVENGKIFQWMIKIMMYNHFWMTQKLKLWALCLMKIELGSSSCLRISTRFVL